MSARRAEVCDWSVAAVVMGVATPFLTVAPFFTEPSGPVSTPVTLDEYTAPVVPKPKRR